MDGDYVLLDSLMADADMYKRLEDLSNAQFLSLVETSIADAEEQCKYYSHPAYRAVLDGVHRKIFLRFCLLVERGII